MKPLAVCLMLNSLAALVLSACSAGQAPPAALVERSRVGMGSELRLSAWTADEPLAVSAFDEVFHEFDRLEDLLSVWRTGSDVVRLNAAAGERPVAVSREMREVLQIAREVSDLTDGKFDITFGALADLWKFDHDQDNSVPDPMEVRDRLPLIDYRAVEVNDHDGTAYITRPGVRVHLGGIGKGYAVDRAAAILRRRRLNDFMIQAGGDLYVAGRHGTRPWRVAIRDPRGPADRVFAALDLSNATFSTSGDYERAFMKDGRRYHHIIDPATGQPARGCRSVTLVSDRAVLADALAKGVFILGARKGMALIERVPGVEGVIVSDVNEVLVSSGLENRLIMLQEPTDGP